MATSVTKGGTQKLPQKIKIVETYCHDHSLESSRGALSDGTNSFSTIFEGEIHFLNFSKKPSVLRANFSPARFAKNGNVR
jgi:hypothetical protein